MLSSKSREHRMRVLENQARLAAERGAANNPQMQMPLLVEVKSKADVRPTVRRPRRKARLEQPDLDSL
jgi:hypothetical protein